MKKIGKSKKSNAVKKVDTRINRALKKKGLVPEVKLFDNNLTVTNLPKSDGPAYSTLLNNIVQGDGVSQRDGNELFLKGISFKAIICPKNIPAIGQSATSGNNLASMVGVRFLIVMDKQNISDTTPALSDVIQATLSNDLPLVSPQTIPQQKRFTILYNKVKFCEVSKNYHIFKKYIKLNKKVLYNGTAATDIQKNGIYLFCWYNDFGVPVSGSSTNEGPRFIYWSRCFYTDC